MELRKQLVKTSKNFQISTEFSTGERGQITLIALLKSIPINTKVITLNIIFPTTLTTEVFFDYVSLNHKLSCASLFI